MVTQLKGIELLKWYAEAGVDETIASSPADHFAARSDFRAAASSVLAEASTLRETASRFDEPMAQDMAKQKLTAESQAPKAAQVPVQIPSRAMAGARALAETCHTLEALREAVLSFDGCVLKRTAKKTVFADGHIGARVMIIGEAPGEQEDEQGIPFCGKSGQLLDNALASIGLKRTENVYITNTIFWRPPGNRTPSPEEVAICAPFVKKHIALKKPDLLILAGGVAGSVLGSAESVSKLRRKFHHYTNEYLTKEIPAVVIYHPSYLLRQPGQKAEAWQDLLMIQEFLAKH